YLDRSREIFEELMSPASLGRSWEKLLDSAIDAFNALDRGDMDFRAVWANWHLSADFFVAGQALNREFAKRVEQVLATHARGLPAGKRGLVATVVVELVSAMLFAAARREGKSGAAIVEESKLMLRRYLKPYTRG